MSACRLAVFLLLVTSAVALRKETADAAIEQLAHDVIDMKSDEAHNSQSVQEAAKSQVVNEEKAVANESILEHGMSSAAIDLGFPNLGFNPNSIPCVSNVCADYDTKGILTKTYEHGLGCKILGEQCCSCKMKPIFMCATTPAFGMEFDSKATKLIVNGMGAGYCRVAEWVYIAVPIAVLVFLVGCYKLCKRR